MTSMLPVFGILPTVQCK